MTAASLRSGSRHRRTGAASEAKIKAWVFVPAPAINAATASSKLGQSRSVIQRPSATAPPSKKQNAITSFLYSAAWRRSTGTEAVIRATTASARRLAPHHRRANASAATTNTT